MKPKISIVLIEDETNISNFISTTLTAQGYMLTCTSTGKEGLSAIKKLSPQLILLDLGLPDIDGNSIISQVRAFSPLPIIVISARLRESDKVIALDLGADDYITKPFGTKELVARIRTALRHSNTNFPALLNADSTYQSKDLTINLDKHQVLLDGKTVHLTPIEFKILSILVMHVGRVVTYDKLLTQIWGPYTDDSNRILRVNMANIRRKLERNPADPQYIFTELGIGYRLSDEM